MYTILCLSPDDHLLAALLRAGYNVKYIPGKWQFGSFLDEKPDAIFLDGLMTKEEIEMVSKMFPSHPFLFIRSSFAESAEWIEVFRSGTENNVMLESIKKVLEGEMNVPQIPKTILIIEDNKSINEMYQIAFSQAWCTVVSAFDWLEGITKASTLKPDIILLDLMMPNMDGLEVLKVLKNNTSLHTKVIVNSNLEWVDEENRARALWADGFLKKSAYTPLEVVNLILEWNI